MAAAMFPLSGTAFPTDADQLAAGIRGALAEVFALPAEDSAVKVVVDGKGFPQVERVKIDLSGASVNATEPPPKPTPSGARQPGVHVDTLEVVGHPIKYGQHKLDLTLNARDVQFDFARDKTSRPLLVLTDARDGHVEAKISKADLEALLLTVARELAKEQNIQVRELELNLTSQGPRSLAADARVKAAKMLMSGTIRIMGRLDVDDELNATISGLRAEGEGMIGKLAAGVVQKHLNPVNGRRFPLMTFSLGDVTLRDLEIVANTNVQVSAKFGSAKS
jgi:hypothetical protein